MPIEVVIAAVIQFHGQLRELRLLRQHADVSLRSPHRNQCIPVSHFNRSV